ncbi:NAD(P)/FAD-dependent oxidoreductase [Sulfitobacter porphyrae]|uniref:NAD(P)/FAD-dependent oxidoreductase n=1 Tax=Sulfitobacter porphyrae TaxID=1246864 RepID=A0ABW2B7B0_9RHOB
MAFQSIWADTGPAAPTFALLDDSLRCDVLVIGGGFQGLSAALHLAEAGTDVVLVEAQEPGFGASGRNGGQVIPGLKDDPDTLDRLWGPEATAFAGGTADTLFALVARLGIDCDAVQGAGFRPETAMCICLSCRRACGNGRRVAWPPTGWTLRRWHR